MSSAPIRTLLIANRGEIARRIIRTAHEMGIRTVAVFAEPDRLSPHVLEADVSIPLKGETALETYLDREEILRAAEWQGADAIHPGYGFLSERASFARAVQAAGLTWVGPPPDAITTMGDKVLAKQTAADAAVPTLPWALLAGDDPAAWTAQVAAVPFPLIVKAAAGGGGRGMRLVHEPDALAEAVLAAQREAASSFGNATVYAETWVPAGRHIEIQVLADAHGNIVHLGERECSIQRRHQKLVEEAPSTAVDPTLRHQMTEAAMGLARAIGYEGLGTVEFLVDDSGDSPAFWFLEMNTRLQVEHPVTEAITGLDLVRLQLQVAQGEPLPMTQSDIHFRGHAVEVRVCAEDPAAGWLPSTGRITRWEPGPTPGVRYDAGVLSGSWVSPHYDSLLAKAIAFADTRIEASARLARALRELTIHGVTTNREYLYDVLTSDDFRDGLTRTDFVDRHPPLPDWPEGEDQPMERQWQRFNAVTGPHLAAVALVAQRRRRAASPWPFVPSGWRNVGGRTTELQPGSAFWQLLDAPVGFASQSITYRSQGRDWHVSYTHVSRDHPLERARRLEAVRRGDPAVADAIYSVAISGPTGSTTTLVELVPVEEADGSATVVVHFGRRGHRCTVHWEGTTWYVNSPLGQSRFDEVPPFSSAERVESSGGPVAPVPGRVVAVNVAAGDQVEAGDTLVVLEAMKVEHRVTTPGPATVLEVLVASGDTVDAHQLLVRLESREVPADPHPESDR